LQQGANHTIVTREPKRCLSEEFLNASYDRNDFGHERIELAKHLRNISFAGMSMPLALAASYGWESGHTVTAIVDILLREVFGVNTEFVCTWGSVHTMALLGGCNITNPWNVGEVFPCYGDSKLPSPLAHVSVESWVTTIDERKAMNAHNANLGMLGYASKSGLHFDRAIATKAFEEDQVSLEWWESFVKPDVSKYFDTYQDVASDIASYFNVSFCSEWLDHFQDGDTCGELCRMSLAHHRIPIQEGRRSCARWSFFQAAEPQCKEGDPGHFALSSRNLGCTDGWYLSSACAKNTSSCVPVILAEFDWNGMPWIDAAEKNGYRFAITWLGAHNWLSYSMDTTKKFMFYCASTNALCSAKPLAKMFGDTKMPVGRPDFITSLLKVVWNELPSVEAEVHEFISQINFPSADLDTDESV